MSEKSNILTETNEYKQAISLIKDTEKEYNELKKMLLDSLETDYNLFPEILDSIMSVKNIKEDETADSDTIEYLRSLFMRYETSDYKYKDMSDEDVLETLRNVKAMSNVIKTSEKELSSMKKDASSLVSGYISYISSDEAVKSRSEKLKAMKDAYDIETDPYSKQKMKEKIDILESTFTYSFLYKKLSDKKEVDKIVEAFFNKKKGSYIIDKFTDKMHLFKYDPKIYKMFFNLEENFLPEEYHDFNNLFLFIYMRYAAYKNPYKKNDFISVHSITSAISRLVYHKFKSKDSDEEITSEPEFIETIKKVLDYFKDYKEVFHTNNTTRPGHEKRVEAQMQHETSRKSLLIKRFDDLGLKEGVDYSYKMTADEMQEIFNKKTDELIEMQRLEMNGVEETNDEKVNVTEKEDGSVEISPNINLKNDFDINRYKINTDTNESFMDLSEKMIKSMQGEN